MEKFCIICGKLSTYKCPTCTSTYYCSVACYKQHSTSGCNPPTSIKNETTITTNANRPRYPTADTVPLEKLELLRTSKALGDLLCNPHLRNLLTTINNTKDPEKIMEMAMQEPLFVEFADVCLPLVESDEKES